MNAPTNNKTLLAARAVTAQEAASQITVEAMAVDLILERKAQIGTGGRYLPIDRLAERAVLAVLDRHLPVPEPAAPRFTDTGQPGADNALTPAEQAIKDALVGRTPDPDGQNGDDDQKQDGGK